ncbi:TPA: hypothetical protein PXM11_003774 [Yersinia enterocolitica]|nr:hypothetical protein [Yersinia enterocolitica]HDL6989021.1 hypothetical protein [Yersinia enterocolitica]HDL7114126.1 hypothetical protein [Yersinia enterocolitica]
MANEITLLPLPENISIYQGRIVELTISEIFDTIPTDITSVYATITASNNTKINFIGVSNGIKLVQSIANPNEFTAKAYATASGFSLTTEADNQFIFNIEVTYSTNDPQRQKSTYKSAVYDILPKAKVSYTHYSSNYLPVAPDNLRTPADATYTSSMTATVKTPDGLNVIPDYIIDWRQENPSGLFFDRVKVFSKDTLVVPTAGYKNQYSSFIRTQTDANGQVVINIVSTTNPTYCQLYSAAISNVKYSISNIIIADLSNGNSIFDAPTVYLSQDLNAVYELDSTTVPDVKIGFPRNDNLSSGYAAFGFLNGTLVFDCLYDAANSMTYDFAPKANFYSNFGPNSGKLNELCYVLSSPEGASVYTSSSAEFYAKGGEDSNRPDPTARRDVMAPVIPGSELYVRSGVLNKPTVPLRVSLDFSMLWPPQADQYLTATLYFNGYQPGTDLPIQGKQSLDKAIVAEDIIAKYIDIEFPSDYFAGYDSKFSDRSVTRNLYGEYQVWSTKEDHDTNVPPIHISNIYTASLDTVPPGGSLADES